ncbi:hypothetical protein LZC95_35765 [Pendulispora brunnea]|uniref:Aminoglycoside phosphotransferase domain-containing protein n=1 Tax=Pendulispora brunnea TaxID=2905690 RepID=A0ABZ2JZ86_9BACT
MLEPGGPEVWGSADWRAQAVAWLDERLAAVGIERTGEVEQPHLRPWATALKVPTSRGIVWLKAAGPGTAFEVALYELLHRVVPERVLTPIAVDASRGWIALPDGGPLLGDVARENLPEALVAVVPEYGQLQRDLAPHVDALLAVGVTDMRPAIMPTRFDEACSVVRALVDRSGSAAERHTVSRISECRDTFVSWCEQLASAPASPTLDHNDLHPWNILAPHLESDRARFYDWGDSVVAHPFGGMRITLTSLGDHLRTNASDPRITRVRDAYLEAFSDLAPRADLATAFELSCRINKVIRTLTWARAVNATGTPDEFTRAPLHTLSSLFDPPD